MKVKISFITGSFLGFLISILGGWDMPIQVLLTFMCLDILTGCLSSALGKSKKGRISSKVGWFGLAGKVSTLALVAVGEGIDKITDSNYLRNAVICAFCANEAVSIIENTGELGVPYPKKLKQAVELLMRKDN